MVALLDNDISLAGSRHGCSGDVVHTLSSQLAFGLRRRFSYLFVAGILVFALVLTVRVATGAAAEPPDEAGVTEEGGTSTESTYTVQPGDTLWEVAIELAPGQDPRPTVDRLVELNGSASIAAGQKLTLPHQIAADS